MQNIFEKIQSLPEHHRKIIAVLAMAVLSPIMLYVISGVFLQNLSNYSQPPAAENAYTGEIDAGQEKIGEPSLVTVVIQTASVFVSKWKEVFRLFIGGLGEFTRPLAEFEQKMFPGLNSFMANIFVR